MRKFWISILFILCSQIANATTYNIGPGQTYVTFTALVAAETLAGDDIVDGGGNTFNESWIPDASGTSGHQITLQNATIDGSIAITGWTDDGDGTYSKGSITTCRFLIEDNIPLPVASSAALSDGNWYHDTGSSTVHYKPTSGVATDHTTKRVHYYSGVSLDNKSYITVKNINFQGVLMGVRAIETATTGSASVGLAVEDCTFTRLQYGVYTSVDNSHMFSSLSFTGNVFTNTMAGILCFSHGTGGELHDNTSITNNTFTDVGYTSGSSLWSTVLTGDTDNIGLQNSTDATISGNVGSGGAGKFIYLYIESGSSLTGNTVIRNFARDYGGNGIVVDGEAGGSALSGNAISGNIFNNCGKDATLEDCAVRLGGITTPTGDYNFFYNNTIYDSEIGIFVSTLGDYWNIKNTTISTSSSAHINVGAAHTHMGINYNLYYPDTETPLAWNGTAYNFADWKTNSSQDANSPTPADPLFYNPSLNDFRIHSTSPCIDVGTDLGDTYMHDYLGHHQDDNGTTWDIGACLRFNHLPTIQ